MNPEKFNMVAPGILPGEDEEKIARTVREGGVLITGGTEGIGRAIADEFLKHRNAVAICARTQEKLDETKRDHRGGLSRIIAEKVDLGDRHRTKEFVQGTLDHLGGVDAVILNAAVLDFQYKSSGLSKEDISRNMFKVNEVGNVAIIRQVKDALKESSGTIVFITTRFGIVDNLETASSVSADSASAQEDIGNYIRDKKRIHRYLNDFINDKENDGIFVFSVVPGTVDTPANRELITVGTPEMSAAKLKEREVGKERDTVFVGRVIAKMTASRKKFNPETQRYDVDIENGEIVEISDAAILFEQSQIKRHVLIGNVPYGPDSVKPIEPYFNAEELAEEFPLWHIKNWPQDKKIISIASNALIEKVKRFYGENISDLTFKQLVHGLESIQRDFEVDESLVLITQKELWKRSLGEEGSPPRYIR